MKKLRNNKIRKLLAFMVALALMVSCMPSAYTISASEAFGDGTEDIFTDGEITSEPAAEESTPDVSSADQEETEQAQQSTLTYENDSVKVTAEALEDGALPQNTALKADGVNENSSVSYDTVSQKLSAAATDKGSSLRGFFAYDVYFADGDGNRVEPNGRVRVTFEYKTPAAPELTDVASTSVTVEKLHYNSSTGDTDVNTLQANEDLKVLNVNEGKQIQTLQVETGNAAVFAVMWDSPETADVEAEAVSGNEDEVSIASEELTDGMDISDEPEQDAAETPAAENPEVTPEVEPSEEPAVEPTEAPAENPDAEPTEAPAEDPDVVEEPAEDIESPDEVPAADENGETSLIEVLGDDTNLRVSPSIEAEVLATVNAGTQLTLLDTVTAEDGATWYKVSWEGTEAYIRSDMAQVVDSSDEAEEVEDVLESEEVSYSQEVGDVVVTATAAKDVIPEGVQFVVTPIEKGSDQYEDVADRLEKKAENEDYSIAGFLAYDIYFQDSEGNKINPEDGKVKVSMEYKNATAPDEVKEADAATMAMASADESSQDDTETAEQNLSVSVMHFVEDENGNVESVVDMTKDDTANVETNAEGEVQKAEFETESFSTFTITWKYSSSYYTASKSINVHYVNFEGNDISGNQRDTVNVTSGKSVELGEEFVKKIDNYTYVGARIDKYNGESLKYIKATCTYDRTNKSWSWSIQYSTDNQNWQTSTITNVDIYLLYQEPLSIKDDLMDSGTLIPQISDALQAQINSSKNVKYTWYKSINNGKFEKVKRVKVTKNKYNIEEDATTKLSTMNVALDHGELSNTQTSVKYQVGLSIDGSEEIRSGVYNVEYYRELRNGDFETPNVVKSGHKNTNNWQYSNENYKKLGGVWQTTGTHAASQFSDSEGADIEIVTTATNNLSGYSWHGDVKDASGNNNHDNSLTNGQGKGQFAELNCEASGALYQDVMTYADEKLSYGLSHRARGSNSQTTEHDTMYVVIMPTTLVVKKIWNDGNNANRTRPDSVSFKLQYRDSNSDEWRDYTKDGSNVTVTLTGNNVTKQDTNCWRYEIKNLDVSKEYRVVEQEVPGNYTESYSKDNDFTSITNTLKWKVVKAGSSNNVKLGGAEFKLTNADDETVATGTSANDTGEVSWNKTTAELNGTYTLTETKAPSGYCISGTTWSLVFVNGVLTGLSNESDNRNCNWDGSNATLTITNTELYSLPSAGGPGTYGFTISGVAILATALLLFINNKRREEEAKRS